MKIKKCRYCDQKHTHISECSWNEIQRDIYDLLTFEFSFNGYKKYEDDEQEIRII